MGSEALSHRSRRDIRRAFAPEASAEVLRFVETMRQDVDLKVATVHNEVIAVRETIDKRLARVDERTQAALTAARMHVEQLTFWQRLRWLVTGTWQ